MGPVFLVSSPWALFLGLFSLCGLENLGLQPAHSQVRLRTLCCCPISTQRSIIYGAIEFEGPQGPSSPQPKRASCGNLTLARSNISLRTVEAIKIGKKRVSRRHPRMDVKVDDTYTLRRGRTQLCTAISTVLERWTQNLTIFARDQAVTSIESL